MSKNQHWTTRKEFGSSLGIELLALMMRFTGRRLMRLIVIPVALYYFVISSDVRRASYDYLRRVGVISIGTKGVLNVYVSFKHVLSFAHSMVDRVYIWKNGIKSSDVEISNPQLVERILRRSNKGCIILVSHLGNFDVGISFLNFNEKRTCNILIDAQHINFFNKARRKRIKNANINFIDPQGIDPVTTIDLMDRVSLGEMVVIAADRAPGRKDSGHAKVNFLSGMAHFPTGPYMLAHVLKVPVYTLFIVRSGTRFKLILNHFNDIIDVPRVVREQRLQELAQRYAQCVEKICLAYPLQWYNFYDFWKQKD